MEMEMRQDQQQNNGLQPFQVRRLNSEGFRQRQHSYNVQVRKEHQQFQRHYIVYQQQLIEYEKAKVIMARLRRQSDRTTSITSESAMAFGCGLDTCPKKVSKLEKAKRVVSTFRKNEPKYNRYPGNVSSSDDDAASCYSTISAASRRSRSPIAISGAESQASGF